MFRINVIFTLFRSLLMSRNDLVLENLALRQQLAVLSRTAKPPRMRRRDRIFWVWLSRLWDNWHSSLTIVKPATVIKWQRQGFKIYWRWRSRSKKVGRPRISKEMRDLIRQMSRENPTWRAPRIQSELNLLGYDIAESTVSQYMIRSSKPPSQTWKTLLSGISARI